MVFATAPRQLHNWAARQTARPSTQNTFDFLQLIDKVETAARSSPSAQQAPKRAHGIGTSQPPYSQRFVQFKRAHHALPTASFTQSNETRAVSIHQHSQGRAHAAVAAADARRRRRGAITAFARHFKPRRPHANGGRQNPNLQRTAAPPPRAKRAAATHCCARRAGAPRAPRAAAPPRRCSTPQKTQGAAPAAKWQEPRWKGVERPYSAQDVVAMRGTLQGEAPYQDATAQKLFETLDLCATTGGHSRTYGALDPSKPRHAQAHVHLRFRLAVLVDLILFNDPVRLRGLPLRHGAQEGRPVVQGPEAPRPPGFFQWRKTSII